MRFSVASGTDNSLLQLIANDTEPYGIGGLTHISIEDFILRGPHVDQAWATYTVPANRIARLDHFEITLLRQTVAAPVGLASAYIRIQPFGAGVRTLSRSFIDGVNAIGDRASVFGSPKIIFEEGDIVSIRSLDVSTGGTIYYNNKFSVSELDA